MPPLRLTIHKKKGDVMARRAKRSTPLMLFWSRAEQRRFIDAVERLVSTVQDLEAFLASKKRERRPRPPQGPAAST